MCEYARAGGAFIPQAKRNFLRSVHSLREDVETVATAHHRMMQGRHAMLPLTTTTTTTTTAMAQTTTTTRWPDDI